MDTSDLYNLIVTRKFKLLFHIDFSLFVDDIGIELDSQVDPAWNEGPEISWKVKGS